MSTRDIKFQKQNRRIPYISRLLRFWYCLYTQVVPAVEVVQSRFGVVVISAVAQGVDRAEGGGGRAVDLEQLAERAIGILNNAVAVRVQQGKYIAAEIAEVIHRCAAIGHAVGVAVRVILKVDRLTYTGLLKKHLRAVHHISGRSAVYRFPCADPVGVVGEGQSLISYCRSLQLSPVPSKRHPVSPCQRVADFNVDFPCLAASKRFDAAKCG